MSPPAEHISMGLDVVDESTLIERNTTISGEESIFPSSDPNTVSQMVDSRGIPSLPDKSTPRSGPAHAQEAMAALTASTDIGLNNAREHGTMVNGNNSLALPNSSTNANTMSPSIHIYVSTPSPTERQGVEVSYETSRSTKNRAQIHIHDPETQAGSEAVKAETSFEVREHFEMSFKGSLSAENLRLNIHELNKKCNEIDYDYKGLCAKLRKIRNYNWRDVVDQHRRFKTLHSSLLESVGDESNNPGRPGMMTMNNVPGVLERLKSIGEHLRLLNDTIVSIRKEPETKSKSRASSNKLKHLLSSHVKILQKTFEGFEALVRPIIGEPPVFSERYDAELKKLSVEGQAASRLYYSLSQCCPGNHNHTAIIFLKPRISDDLNPTATSEAWTRTECHMAIKPYKDNNDNLIWLKVVSDFEEGLIGSSAKPTSEDANVSPTVSTNITPNKTGRKRQRSEDTDQTQGPPAKAAKTQEGQSIPKSNSTASVIQNIQVCPACLAPHGGEPSFQTNRPVMMMSDVDTGTWHHRVFYLPEDMRPPLQRLCLAQALLGWKDRSSLTSPTPSKKAWVASVARLVAESVLRFNWRDMRRRGPQLENLAFYRSSEPSLTLFETLLEFQIEIEQVHSGFSATVFDSPATRREMLLNLGNILVEVWLPQGNEGAYLKQMGAEKAREHLLAMSESTNLSSAEHGMGSQYAEVIKSCAKFEVPLLKENNTAIDETDFQSKFFRHIVIPLRLLEEAFRGGTIKRH